MMTKQELRKRIRDNIRLMGTTEKKAESECICRQIIATNEWQDARTVWLYASMPDEVNLTLLMQHAAQSGKRIVLPVVDGDNLLIRHYEPEHTSMSGVYNIEEPTSLCPTLDNLDEIDIAIIPGRAFTHDGERMGRGKGFYDRILASLRCPKWGVAFSCQIVDSLSTDPWDITLDNVFYPKKVSLY